MAMAVAEQETRPGTRDRILDAMFEAVADFGISRTTVEDVAHRAGLSRQTVYRYFPSKDILVLALVVREEEKFLDGIRRAFTGQEDTLDALNDSTLFVLRYAREHPLLDRLLETDQATFLPYLTTRSLFVIIRARDVMAELVRERIPDADRSTLQTAVDILIRATLSYMIASSEIPLDHVARTMARMLYSTLQEGGR
jgi:AcrR family transcriptional regulator